MSNHRLLGANEVGMLLRGEAGLYLRFIDHTADIGIDRLHSDQLLKFRAIALDMARTFKASFILAIAERFRVLLARSSPSDYVHDIRLTKAEQRSRPGPLSEAQP